MLQEWGTYSNIRMGYKASGYTFRHTEFSVNRKVQIKMLCSPTIGWPRQRPGRADARPLRANSDTIDRARWRRSSQVRAPA